MLFFFFKQKTAYEMRISDWSSDVCPSDLAIEEGADGTVLEIDCKERLYRATSNAPSLAEARVTVFWSPASCTSARIRISLAEPVPDALAVAMDAGTAAATDRKSTRLNSSH